MQLGQDSPILPSATTVTPVPGQDRFFGGEAGAPSLRDVVDTINPLEHIPFVSTLFDHLTGHTPSMASKLAGGAILGGPIGFVASLADVIFTQQTGKPMGEAMVAALTGDDLPPPQTQLASADPVPDASQSATAAPVDEVAVIEPTSQEILPPVGTRRAAAMKLASAVPSSGGAAVLDLYGGSAASAHNSYRKAQLLPYLQDVNHSAVL